MSFESEPLHVQQPGYEPLQPEKPHTSTPAFMFLAAFIALIGLAATWYAIAANPLANVPSSSLLRYVAAYHLAALALNMVLFAACLVGWWFTRSALLRVGLLLQAIASLWPMFLAWPSFILAFHLNNLNAHWMASLYLSLFVLYTPPVMSLVELAAALLSVLSLLSFSYGLARWQRSDNLFIWLQLLVTLGLGFVILKITPSLQNPSWEAVLWETLSPFLTIAACLCLLLRPACWKANPLIVLCLTVGTAALLLFNEVFFRFFSAPGIGPAIHYYQLSSGISFVGTTLFLLGLLLLIQRGRRKKPGAPEAGG